jgi:phage-related protein
MTAVKPVVFLSKEIKIPPWSEKALLKVASPIRRLQQGKTVSMPESRPMPRIGPRCHELRIKADKSTWRVVYRMDRNAIVIVEVFKKKTNKTPKFIIDTCKKRLARYDSMAR